MHIYHTYDFIFKKSKYNHIRKSYMAQIDKKHPHANIDISAIRNIIFIIILLQSHLVCIIPNIISFFGVHVAGNMVV